ncbi:glycogen synthase [Sorangium cellulosum]|uniref:Glycogen synthase n=2 Tax=Sorangium cellulosum TaxID=56 RepID=A0A4P2PV52_SORCE|nr:glycogen/starch synthase [Sorangium cellulosum]AUX20574.1 glycogen synthase [Sorangium cellulosum]
MSMPRLKILFVVSECVPFAKTGGLADVAGALPMALAAAGHDVRVVLPAYSVCKRYLAHQAALAEALPEGTRPLAAPAVAAQAAAATSAAALADAAPSSAAPARVAAAAEQGGGAAPPPERFAPRRLPAPLGVPLGGGEAWAAVWETRLDPGAPGAPAPRVYLLEHDALFDRDGIYGDAHGEFGDNLARYAFLSRGALQLCHALGFWPDIVHVHDWQAALVPLYLNVLEHRSPLGRAASVLTIHNLGYQGWFNKMQLPTTGLGWDQFHRFCLEAYDSLNLLKAGIYNATLVSTVSPRYAQEIQTPEGGEGLDGVLRDRGTDVIGILNGIDDAVWNPATDPHIAANYSAEDLSGKRLCKAALQREMGLDERPEVPVLGLISRLATQKGIDILAGALDHILSLDVQLVVLGSGERWAEDLFSRLSGSSDRVRVYVGMNEGLAHRIEAGADLFLMPSRYEPCGLNQLYSQRYGTLPIVRAVGGLDDTVENNITGFKFEEMSSMALGNTVAWAVHVYRADPAFFRTMQLRAMKKNFGWAHAARQYEALYRLAISRRTGRPVGSL